MSNSSIPFGGRIRVPAGCIRNSGPEPLAARSGPRLPPSTATHSPSILMTAAGAHLLSDRLESRLRRRSRFPSTRRASIHQLLRNGGLSCPDRHFKKRAEARGPSRVREKGGRNRPFPSRPRGTARSSAAGQLRAGLRSRRYSKLRAPRVPGDARLSSPARESGLAPRVNSEPGLRIAGDTELPVPRKTSRRFRSGSSLGCAGQAGVFA